MSQGDVAKRRSDLIAEARNEIDGTRYGPRYAHANEVLATEYEKVGNNHPAIAATMRLAGSLQDAHDVLGRLADELATAERERIALQDKVDAARSYIPCESEFRRWRDDAVESHGVKAAFFAGWSGALYEIDHPTPRVVGEAYSNDCKPKPITPEDRARSRALYAALSDEPELDAAVTVALDAGMWNAEHGAE